MWLHIPAASLASVQATADSNWDSDLPYRRLAPHVTLSGKPTQPRSLQRASQKNPWMTRLSGPTYPPSTLARGVASWIQSLGDTPVNPSPSPVGAEEPMTPATCGPTSPDSSGNSTPAGASLRMSATTSTSDLNRSEMTFAAWATGLKQEYSARRKSAQATAANACSSWPTPRNSDMNRPGIHGTGGQDLRTIADLWPTPTTRDWKDGANPSEAVATNGLLVRAAPRWMTPRARDAEAEGVEGGLRRLEKYSTQQLATQATTWASSHPDPTPATSGPASSPSAPTSPRRLNPLFVGWLMGLPEGWLSAGTSFAPGAMASYLCRQRMHLRRLLESSERSDG